MRDKISASHLERTAYVYIRQSTLQQVRCNLESSRRQYALRERALELGFGKVVVIDEDLGVSGAGNRERPGFGRLLAAVCDGLAGAVLSLEASRLARNNRDWHHLIDLCMLTGTVVVDGEGVYDPRLLNDRLLLGLKGTMSEFELGILRQRAQEACRQKVLRGEVLTRVPIGYIRGGPAGMEPTPDLEVREAISSVFASFARMGTLRQVLLGHHTEKIPLPCQRIEEGRHSVIWRLPDYQQLLRILKNPVYAGAFAYGRTQCRTRMDSGRSFKTGGHKVPMENWQVLIKDHHPAYIPWEQYLENQRLLNSNRTKSHAATPGAAREGHALLAGLLRCARCGHKLHVGYRGRTGKAPRYYCAAGNKGQGKPSCLCFAGHRMEKAVVDAVLEACQPMGVEASLRVLESGQEERAQKRRALELALERARHEADRARRQYDAVDPGNRLVAAELETRWNAALAKAGEAQVRLESETSAPPLTENQRRRLLTLGQDLSAAWHDPAAPPALKKRILRTVLHEIVADVSHDTGHVEMRLHWAGGVHTELRVRKNKPGRNGRATERDVVQLVRELARTQSDQHIASILNRQGSRTGPGNDWNQTRIKNLRQSHGIPVFGEDPHRAWVTMTGAAGQLQAGVTVIRTLIRKNILPAAQVTASAPWMIQRADLEKPEVLEYVRRARAGKPVPQSQNNNQLLLPNL